MGHYDSQREAFHVEALLKALEWDRPRIIPKLRRLQNALQVLGLQGGSVISDAIDHLVYVAKYEDKT